MKEKTHLIYGIIIGILLFACTGSLKEDKAEFEVEEVIWVGSQGANERMAELKKQGWTIIDFEILREGRANIFWFHIGQ